MPNPNNTEATNAILKKMSSILDETIDLVKKENEKEKLGETPKPAKDYLNSTGILEESALPYISYVLKEGK